jgi:hypothetical protein
MGARKQPRQIGQPQGTSAATYANYTAPLRNTEQQAYRQVQPRTTDSYATRAQPSPSSYQQMHMKMLQDRAASKQSPMVRQDTANDQRMNEYMNQQRAEQDRARFMQATQPRQPRRFSWQR